MTDPVVDGSVLLLFHCSTNTGYAIGALERVFHRMAVRLTGNDARVHYGYPSLTGGRPAHLPDGFERVHEMDRQTSDRATLRALRDWVRRENIRLVFAFDLPVSCPILGALRAGGVEVIVSYWGASISAPYPRWLQPLRRLQLLAAGNRPDHFIFESEGMRDGATRGAMIPPHESSVCRLGVDPDRYYPRRAVDYYAHDVFGIPRDRRIAFFSGHMEHRKGVHVLIRAMVDLVEARQRRDVHLLIVGNQPGEERAFAPLYAGGAAAQFITFGGYRSDLDALHGSMYLGAIASTGWDSFTLSAVEMASSGLPLLVSDLPGLAEAVVDGVTGRLLPAGDATALASAIVELLDHPDERDRLGAAARARVLEEFTLQRQEDRLVSIVSSAWTRCRRR